MDGETVMPAVTSVPPVTITMTDGTYTISAANKRDPFNATNRYEMPLKDGLVFVLLDTPSLGHASYIIERRKPGVYGTPLPLVDYAITITDPRYGFTNTQTVTGHGQWQRWRVQNKRWPFVGITEPELVFNVDPRATKATVKTVPEPTPLFSGNLQKAMGTTGLRNDIGVYTGWLANAIRINSFDNALRNAEAAASIPWHVRDDAGKVVLLSGLENIDRQMRTYYGTHSTTANTIDENTSWSMDQAHMPKAAWSGYVVNSANPDPYMVEELQFEAAALMNQTAKISKNVAPAPGYMIARGQGRDYAWGMVSLVHALRATPATVPDWLLSRAQLQAIIEPNLVLGVELTKLSPGFDMQSISTGKDSLSKTADTISTQSNIIHYVAFAMAHCYRLTGDERFMTIGRAHVDRRWAKQIKASPRYMALYAPVGVGTGTGWRYFTDWAEAYRVRGLLSDETTAWNSWTLPTGSEVDPVTGERLSSYNGNSSSMALVAATLYKDMGFSTPDIDWMVAFLEGKRGTAGLYLEEQFAVTK